MPTDNEKDTLLLDVATPSSAEPRVIIELNRQVQMRDGVHLCTDIYRPAGPVIATILLRTIYSSKNIVLMYIARKMAKRGFALVVQNARGRNGSEGAFQAFSNENDDGFDTLQWIGGQLWCNGKIGLLGLCYSVYTNYLLMSIEPPPGISIITAVSCAELVDVYDLIVPGGALRLHWALPWLIMMMNSTQSDPAELRSTRKPPLQWNTAITSLPLSQVEKKLECEVPNWKSWLEHPAYDQFWKKLNIEAAISRISQPVLHVGGWFDPCREQTIRSYNQFKSLHANHSLILGPWNHENIFQCMGGTRDAGHADPVLAFPLFDRVMNWFEKWSGESSASEALRPGIELYVTGEEQWYRAENWGNWSTKWAKLYLRNDGAMQLGHPPAESMSSFEYDPLHPRPTLGGDVFPFGNLEPGPIDQSKIEQRPDTLIFTTEPFSTPVFIAGMLRAVLYVASSAPDTDFTAAVTDVAPNGTSRLLVDTIARMRFRESNGKSKLIDPGMVYKLDMQIGHVAHLFREGHRLRMAVSSSNFPKFSRNLNLAAAPEFSPAGVTAKQKVCFGGLRASYLHVPVTVPEGLEVLHV